MFLRCVRAWVRGCRVWLDLFVLPVLVLLFPVVCMWGYCLGTKGGLVFVVKLEAPSLPQGRLLHSHCTGPLALLSPYLLSSPPLVLPWWPVFVGATHPPGCSNVPSKTEASITTRILSERWTGAGCCLSGLISQSAGYFFFSSDATGCLAQKREQRPGKCYLI